jgi:hypothetical protein
MAEAGNKPPDLKQVDQDGSVPAIASSRRQPVFGTLKNKIVIKDPDWWKPMSDLEVNDFIEGRD